MRKLIALLLILVLLPLVASADVLGVPVPDGETTLDLTGLTKVDSRVSTLISDLKGHPEVTAVDLTGVNLSLKNKATLAKTVPAVHFVWTVELKNAVISSEDTVMDLDTPKGEAKLSEIAQALDAPIRMYQHCASLPEWALNVAVQVGWIFILRWIGRAMWNRQLDNLIVQGG